VVEVGAVLEEEWAAAAVQEEVGNINCIINLNI
jgi:hypothetical protein